MRKKLFAVIMSVMMMVTFMPAMAFAAELYDGTPTHDITKVVYSGDYSRATAYYVDANGKTQKIEGFVDKGDEVDFKKDSGKMVVTFTFETAEVKLGKVTKEFYNLNDSVVVKEGNVLATDFTYPTDNWVEPDKQAANGVPAHYDTNVAPIGNYLRFVNPARKTQTFAKKASEISNLEFMVQKSDYEAWNEGEVKFPLYIQKKAYDLTVEVTASATAVTGMVWHTASKQGDYTDAVVGITGAAPTSQSLNVKIDGTLDINTVPVKVNGVSNSYDLMSGSVTADYTGKNLTVEPLNKKLDLQYQLVDYSGNTNNWSATLPEMKNAGDYRVNVKATKTYGDKASVEFTTVFHINALEVIPYWSSKAPTVATIDSTPSFTFHEGQEIANSDLITLWTKVAVPANDVDYKYVKVKMTDEDQAIWNTIANGSFEIEGIKDIVGEYTITAAYTTATNTTSSTEEVDPALVQFIKNFGFDNGMDTDQLFEDEATLKIVEGKNDVTAISQSKTYHVKNAKALKSKKTFKLKGDEADWGTLTYKKLSGNSKISVSKAGKVTVKKGLKKGTYTVKIKVKAPGDSATKTLKVKIKK